MAEKTRSGAGQTTAAGSNNDVFQLEKHIEELSLAAAESANKLRSANAAKDEFVGMVSHELRTPITVILGNATVLLKSMTFENEAHYGALLDIRTEAERLNRLVSNMLVLTKLDGSHISDLEPVLLGPVVTRVAAEHKRRYPKRILSIQLQDSSTPCLANESYVEQILANLLSNAEKYSEPSEAIELSLRCEGGQMTLLVADRGIGLSLVDINHLFEALPLSGAPAKLYEGIGIGLAACKRLVDTQDGKIWARARDGGGAEFAFTLPIIEDS